MLIKIAAFFAFFPVVHSCSPRVVFAEEPCISSYAELTALEIARGNNNAVRVTYVICPNTVFDLTGQPQWDLNGNIDYLCGETGSSTNNCVVTGGAFQFSAALFPYNFSSKDNIRLAGF
jgi:hypothetical protein